MDNVDKAVDNLGGAEFTITGLCQLVVVRKFGLMRKVLGVGGMGKWIAPTNFSKLTLNLLTPHTTMCYTNIINKKEEK